MRRSTAVATLYALPSPSAADRIDGVSETDSLRSWSPVLVIVGVSSVLTTLTLATLLPMR